MPGYERSPFFGFQTIFKEQPAVAAFVLATAVQSIPANVVTPLTFATPIDTVGTAAYHSLWDVSTPGQFVITLRGFYMIGASILFEPTSASRIGIAMYLNGVTGVASQEVQRAGGADYAFVSVTTLLPCVEGDVITCRAYQSGAGAVNTALWGWTPNMWIVRVG